MRHLTQLILAVVLTSCGVSTLELGGTEQGVFTSGGMKGATDAGPTQTEPEPEPETVLDAGTPIECEPGMTSSCTTSCGSTGTRSCQAERWTACQPPAERCDNGLDDDCDGRADGSDLECPPTLRTCEAEDGSGCNGDLGYGDHCAPADNTNGCSAERFHAWCNRRNPEFPNLWDDYIRGWVDARCDGPLDETGTQYSTWFCRSSENVEYRCTTPLVLSFDGAPVRFERSPRTFAFTPGRAEHSDWPSPATPWLARDVNGNGHIDDGSELFGSNTRTRGALARHGFEALAALDENGDGRVDAKDPAFSELRAWRDLDGDRRAQPAELTPLADEGIDALSTRYDVAPRCDARGNCERERGAFTTRAGRGVVIDVYLRTWPVATSSHL